MGKYPFQWTNHGDGRWTVSCKRCDWSKTGWSQKKLGYAAGGHGNAAHPDWSPEEDDDEG